MANIELALLNIVPDEKMSVRGKHSSSGAKVEGGFPRALASQKKRLDKECKVDSESNVSAPIRQDEKKSRKAEPEKVEPEKADETQGGEAAVVSDKDLDNPDVEKEAKLKEENSIFTVSVIDLPEIDLKEISSSDKVFVQANISDEIKISDEINVSGEIKVSEEVASSNKITVAGATLFPERVIFSDKKTAQVINESAGIPGRDSGSSSLLGKVDDIAPQEILFASSPATSENLLEEAASSNKITVASATLFSERVIISDKKTAQVIDESAGIPGGDSGSSSLSGKVDDISPQEILFGRSPATSENLEVKVFFSNDSDSWEKAELSEVEQPIIGQTSTDGEQPVLVPGGDFDPEMFGEQENLVTGSVISAEKDFHLQDSSDDSFSMFQSKVAAGGADVDENIDFAEVKVPLKAGGDSGKKAQVEGGKTSKTVMTVGQESTTAMDDVKELQAAGEIHQQTKNAHFTTQPEISLSQTGISTKGNVVSEIPEGVQIHVNNEFIEAKNKTEKSFVRSEQSARVVSFTGDETGISHLQGRARENQSAFIQGEQPHLKDFSEFEADPDEGRKSTFSGISNKVFEESATLPSSMHAVAKEKLVSTHTLLKSDDMVAVQLEAGKDSLVKDSSHTVSAKPLPVSDENLMEQIKTGMARQVQSRQTVTIRLWPESMGKVDVKLVLREQQLSATFMVEQADVKDAMLRKIDSLRDSLGVRGIDVKTVDIKVAPTKFGDGPAVTVGDQHQDSSETWRQYHQGEFAQSNSGSEHSSRVKGLGEDEYLLSGNISNSFALAKGIGGVPGSLHITA